MILFALLSRDPAGLVSAASSIARAWEEYGPKRVTIIYTPGVSESVISALERWGTRLVGHGGIESVIVDSSPESLAGHDRDMLAARLAEIVGERCSGEGVLLVSSGSRRLATAAALVVAEAVDCKLDIVHVHFYFGPWSGLPYPYTPLRLQPLIVMRGRGPRGEGGGSSARLMYEAMSESAAKLVLGRLPPLRSVVAELARRMNALVRPRYVLPGGEARCGKLIIETDIQTLPAAELCNDRDVANLASKLGGLFLGLEDDLGIEVRSLLAWTGLAEMRARTGRGVEPLASLMLREKPVVDSSVVYYGVHRYFWEGADLYVPECLIREIHMNMAESIKTRRLRHGKGAAKAVVDVLSYLSLRDMLESGAPVLPTAPGYCDTSIPKIDPLILEGKILVTGDSGAIRYWKSHPTRKIVKDIVLASFEPDSALIQKVDPRRDPASLPRLFYSVYQAIIALGLMTKLGALKTSQTPKVYIESEGERSEVKIPVTTLLKAIGYA